MKYENKEKKKEIVFKNVFEFFKLLCAETLAETCKFICVKFTDAFFMISNVIIYLLRLSLTYNLSFFWKT